MRFLYDAPALLHKGALIVGDTHLGMERKLRRKGVYDEMFSERIFERLKKFVVSYRAKKVIFLGDVKEDITVLDSKTSQLLARLSMLCEIIIVKGNHDGGIENCGCAKIIPSEGFVYEGLGLAHGHSWPAEDLMNAEYIVVGHQHPVIAMTDSLGKRHSEPGWVIAECDKKNLSKHYRKFNKKIRLILMPAFNPVVGSVINTSNKERLGPLLNNNIFKLSDALVFRLDGTCLGNLKNIK